jgi:O-acetylhomoserine (thiol)-lyase
MTTGAADPTPGDRAWGFHTRALHAGNRPDPTTGARAVPIYQTTSFVFEDTADAADLFALQKYGNIYTRIANPTVAAFEERLASLEGGIGAVATASGMSAEALLFTAVAGAGDHIVASSALYGGTRTLLEVTLRRLGIDTTFVVPDDPASFAAAMGPRTKLLFTEVVGNPSGVVADLTALAEIAHASSVPLAVDATTATPYLCRPFEFGADIVVHSATKFIGGHGTSLGGVIVDRGDFDWGSGRFPTMTEPVASYGGLRYWENFGEYGFCTKLRVEQLRDLGPALSPFNAFLLLQGTETLALRMERHVANAAAVAEFLAGHPAVSWVRYAGLADHPQHRLAQRYLPRGPGAVLAFGVRGGRRAGAAFIEATQLCSHLANIGDTRTLVIHPASTTHQQLSAAALEAAGVGEDLVRISVGLEDLDDIVWDLDQALAHAAKEVQG